MPKILLNQEILQFIKDERLKNTITAKDFSARIGKTASYITKLEKGDFKALDLNDLYKYIGYMQVDDCSTITKEEIIKLGQPIVNSFLDEYILSIPFGEGNHKPYNGDSGLRTYDEVHRTISIPEELIDYINSYIEKYEIDTEELIYNCNENPDIEDLYKKNNEYKRNEYYIAENGDAGFIIVSVNEEEVRALLNKSRSTTSFITLLMILYTMNRMNKVNPINTADAHQFAYGTLEKYHCYSKEMERKLNFINQFKDNMFPLLSNLPFNATYIVAKLIGYFDYMSEIDLNYTIDRFFWIVNNLNVEPSLLLSLMEVDLEPLEKVSIDKKRAFLNDVQDLVEKYSQDSDKNELDLL